MSTDLADELGYDTGEPDPEPPAAHPDDALLWCRDSGGPGDCFFRSESPAGLKRHQTRQHGPPPAPDETTVSPGAEARDGTARGPEEPVRERVPNPKPTRTGLVNRWRERLRSGKSAAAPASKPKPKPSKRISLAGDITDAYHDIGARLSYTPHYPAGRMLTYQAPAAGVILDNAVNGTTLDRLVLQPIWRQKDKWEDIVYLTAPPVLLFMMQGVRIAQAQAHAEGNLDLARQLDARFNAEAAFLRSMLRRSMLRMAPAVAEARARMDAEEEVMREAFPELVPGVDPVDALLSALFAPPGQEEAFADVGYSNGDGSPPA